MHLAHKIKNRDLDQRKRQALISTMNERALSNRQKEIELLQREIETLTKAHAEAGNSPARLLEKSERIHDSLEKLVNRLAPDVQQMSIVGLEMATLKGDKGDKGDTGETGERGFNGQDGKDGVDGKDGRDGTNGKNGIDGLNGINGKDGKDGSPDTAEQIRKKLEGLVGDSRLSMGAIKGLLERLEALERKPLGAAQRSHVFTQTILETSSTVDDSNVNFIFTQKPRLLFVNGAGYRENKGWTWSGVTATLDNPLGTNGDIYGLA